MPDKSIQADLQERLGAFLGPNTARVAIVAFAKKAVNKTPEELTEDDIAAVLEAIGPMLRTLLGEESAKTLTESILEEVLG